MPVLSNGWLRAGAAVLCLTLTFAATALDAEPWRAALDAKSTATLPGVEPRQPRTAPVAPDVPSADRGQPSVSAGLTSIDLRNVATPVPFAQPPLTLPAPTAQRAPGDSIIQFAGIDSTQSAFRPPTVGIAVGPQYVVQTANAGFSVYTKTGLVARAYLPFATFLADNLPAVWNGGFASPRVVYDPSEQRFVMLILGRDAVNEEGYFWLAVSDDSDPRNGWCIRRFRVTDIAPSVTGWLSGAGLGTDAFGVYVTGNHMLWDGSKYGAALRTYPSDIIAGCGAASGWRFNDVQWPGGGDADRLQPAHAHSVNGNEETFFVGTDGVGGDKVLLAKISGDRSNAPTLTRAEISVDPYDAPFESVTQPGTPENIDGGPSNVLSAVYANRRVFLTYASSETLFLSQKTAWRTVKLNIDANVNEWEQSLSPVLSEHLIYPAITLAGSSSAGHLAVFGGLSSDPSHYASAAFKIYEDQPNSAAGPADVAVAGTSPYYWPENNGLNRWGATSGAAYDWFCGHAWGTAQYATGLESYGTAILAHRFDDEPDCPLIYVTQPAAGAVLASGDSGTVRWDTANLPAADSLVVLVSGEGFLDVIADDLPTTATSVQWTAPEYAGEVTFFAGSFDGVRYTAQNWSDPITVIDTIAPSPNPLTFTLAPTADSESALRMATSAVDGSGDPVEYRFAFTGTPGGGTGGDGRDWDLANEHLDTGLSINQQYCYRARARDASQNTTDETPESCAYTLSVEPAPLSYSDVTTNRVTVNWSANGNPPGTEYRVVNVTLGLFTDWMTDLSYRSRPLTSNTEYEFRVRSRNGDQVSTGFVSAGFVTTLAADTDSDGIEDSADNCLGLANPAQVDADGDGIGNLCDADLSQDCIVNVIDLGLLRTRFFSNDPVADFNSDGVVNVQDLGLLRLNFFAPPGPSGIANDCAAAAHR